ncbi:AAA family ATPase [Streptomyces sp. NPDC059881]|uniref:helix-turn-helix transcriptional regulator n=1 Tax=Streptomyces sp. NPDC059881 TaxID=3346986 RepID=UPI00365C8C02
MRRDGIDGSGGLPFVGRRPQLALMGAEAALSAAGRPRVVLVEGPPGAGKRRLVEHFTGGLRDHRVLVVRGSETARDRPYATLAQLLGQLPPAVAGRLPLLSTGVFSPVSPIAVNTELMSALGELAATAPLVLVLEEAHTADERSLDVVASMTRRLTDQRILTIVVAATSAAGPAAADDLGFAADLRITLGGLDAGELGELAVAAGSDAPADRAGRWLHGRTGGNALHATLLLRPRPPRIADTADGPPATGAAPAPAPSPALAATVAARLAGLPDESRLLLEGLAVLGGRVSLLRLGRLVAVSDPAGALDPLLRAGLVRWWPGEPVTDVAPGHELLRDLVYEGLAPDRRRRLHSRAVALVDAGAAWAHRVAAADGPDTSLAAELAAAAREESALGRLATAAAYLSWAADLADGREERERHLIGVVRLKFWAGEGHLVGRYRDLVAAAGPTARRHEVLGLLAFAQGRVVQARRHLTLAQDTAATDGTGPLAAGRMIVELGWVTAVLGLGEETVRAARDALAVLRSADDSHLTVLVRDTAAAARSLDAYGHALASGAEAGLERLAYLPADADQADEADVFGLTFRGMLNCLAGRVSVAASELSTVVRRSRPGTFQVLGLAGYVHLIVCHMLRGSWDRAETETETALSAVEAHGHAIDHAVLHSLAAALAAGRGCDNSAQRHLALADARSVSLDYRGPEFYLALARALAARARDDAEGVLAALAGVVDATRRGNDCCRLYSLWWLPFFVDSAVSAGRVDQARALLDEFHPVPAPAPGPGASTGTGGLELVRLWLTARVHEGEGAHTAAAAAYTRAAETAAAGADIPFYRGLMEQCHGRFLLGRGRHRSGVRELSKSAATFAAMGALAFERASTADLAKARTRTTTTSPDAAALTTLTTRESDVARGVALGRTNREIAEALTISVKTVEYHLARIFAKLAVRDRRELRDLVQRTARSGTGAPRHP